MPVCRVPVPLPLPEALATGPYPYLQLRLQLCYARSLSPLLFSNHAPPTSIHLYYSILYREVVYPISTADRTYSELLAGSELTRSSAFQRIRYPYPYHWTLTRKGHTPKSRPDTPNLRHPIRNFSCTTIFQFVRLTVTITFARQSSHWIRCGGDLLELWIILETSESSVTAASRSPVVPLAAASVSYFLT